MCENIKSNQCFFFIFEWDKGIEPSDACRVEVCRAPPATLIPHVELTL